MSAKPDDALARKVTTNAKADLPDSIGLTAEEALTSPKDVLALGQAIVHELELTDRGSVLQRWLAHHLAEVLASADGAEGGEKTDAEGRAVDLTLKLWSHRRALPESVDPLGGVREAVNVLRLLGPDGNPWEHFGAGRDHVLLRQTFDLLAQVVMMGAALTVAPNQRSLRKEEVLGLSGEERHLVAALAKWRPVAEGATRQALEDFIASGDEVQEGSTSEVVESEDIRRNIIGALSKAKDTLERIIDQWQRPAGAKDE